jgi:hypothetical protein
MKSDSHRAIIQSAPVLPERQRSSGWRRPERQGSGSREILRISGAAAQYGAAGFRQTQPGIVREL